MILLTHIILGDFKWTVLGAGLVLIALLLVQIINKKIKFRFIRILITILLMSVFVWYGHLTVDPKFHSIERWYTTPINESMQITPIAK